MLEAITTRTLEGSLPPACIDPHTSRRRGAIQGGIIPRRLRTKDAAFYLSVSKDKLLSMAHDGILPFMQDKAGGSLYFDRVDLDRYIESSKQTQ